MPWSQAAATRLRASPRATRLPNVAHAPKDSADSCRPEEPRRRYCIGISCGWSSHGIAMESSVRSEEHTSELQSLMRISYAVFCLKKEKTNIMNIFILSFHDNGA